MTVRVTKPEFNIRDKISQLEKPIGVTGAQLMKSETAREAGSILGVGRKNLCVNGNFKCWQRATSIASGASGNATNSYKYLTADHWQTYFYNSYARQEVVLPTGEQVYAMRETMQVIRNFMVNVIEDGGSIWYEGGDITISFWARTSSKRTGVSLGFYFYDDWAGSAYTFTNVRSNVIIEGHQWKHYTVTATIPGNTANRSHLAIEFDNNAYGTWYQLIAGEYWEFANVQIEKGSVATEFEYRSEGEELTLCQRYLVVYGGTDECHLGTANAYTAANINLSLALPTTMRTGNVTLSKVTDGTNWLQSYIGASGTNSNPTPQLGETSNNNVIRLYIPSASSGLTAGQALWCQVLPNAKLIVSAEM